MSAAFSWNPNGVSRSTAGTGRGPSRESRSACTETIVGRGLPGSHDAEQARQATPPAVAFMPRSYGVRPVRPSSAEVIDDGHGRLKADLGDEARRLGFSACGVTSVRPFTEARDRALAAIDAGRMDGMPWYTRDRVEASADIGGRYPWARSIIALAWPYRPARPMPPMTAPGGRCAGRFSAYACTEDGGRTRRLPRPACGALRRAGGLARRAGGRPPRQSVSSITDGRWTAPSQSGPASDSPASTRR